MAIDVTDDGEGMRGAAGLGYGLLGMSERVRALGGRLAFSNRPASARAEVIFAQAGCARRFSTEGETPAGRRLLPEGRAWLLVEFGGEEQRDANAKAEKAFAHLRRSGSHAQGMRLVEDAAGQADVWYIRENGGGASRVPGEEEAWPSMAAIGLAVWLLPRRQRRT